MDMSRLLRILAWLSLLAVLIVTIVPIEFRPETGYSANLERFVVFAIVSAIFASAYPNRPFAIMLLLWTAAIGFELLQFHAFGRHAGLRDVAFKCAGAAAGTSCGIFAKLVLDRLVGLRRET